MSISSHLPHLSALQSGGGMQALAQAAGGTVEARVLAQQLNGLTQVQIGRQVLNLQLPSMPSLGSVLTLAVQQAEGQLKLTLLATVAPGTQQPPPSSATAIVTAAAQHQAPATSVQLSPGAMALTPDAATGAVLVEPKTARVSGLAMQGASIASQAPSPSQPPAVQAPTAPASQTVTLSYAPAAAVLPSASSQTSQPIAVLPLSSPTIAPGVPAAVAAPVGVPAASSAAPRTAIPYPVAAPITAPPSLPLASDAPSRSVVAAVGQALAAGALGAKSTGTPMQARSPVVQPPQPATQQAVLAEMVQRALPRQDSIVGLATALTAVVGKIALPPAVMKAAQHVLAQQVPLDGAKLDGATIQRAVLNSGIFQEAKLAAGLGSVAGNDLKSALLGLQKGLVAWLGNQVPVEQVSSVPPPLRGVAPRARAASATQPEGSADPQEAGKVLLERTEEALSRIRLHQNASLPEAAQQRDAQWSLDLPVTIAGQQNVLQMQIHRDPEEGSVTPGDRGWQVRFAINLGEPGEVGAQISIRGASTGVMIWAENAETAGVLNEHIADLRQELIATGLHPGSVLVRAGAPLSPTAAPAHHLLDETR